MTTGLPGEDPGWGSPHKILLGVLAPWLASKRAATAPNALVALRGVFISFVLALVMIGSVTPFLAGGDSDRSIDPGIAALGVLVIGFAQVLISWRIGGPLKCGSPAELVGHYRTRFFLRIAFADAAALMGFVAVTLAESPLPYLAGLVPAAVGFARVAPTRANLLREQDALVAQGCPHSLYDLLCQSSLGSPLSDGPGDPGDGR